MTHKLKASNQFILSTLFFFFGILSMSNSQAQTEVSAEFRPRTEYQHGFNSLRTNNQDFALFTSQRSRLNFKVQKPKYGLYMVVQDVRVWGSQPQLVANDGALTTLHESYATLKLNNQFGLKLGRQEIIYDDHRIFGNVAWAQQARSHDALLLQFKNDKTKFDVGLAYNQNRMGLKGNFYSVPRSYKTFQYVWANHSFNDNLKLSFLILNNGLQAGKADSAASVKFSQTAGPRLVYKKKALDVILTSYVQTGENRSGNTINALYYRADVGYKLNAKNKASLIYEFLSGNDFFDGKSEENAFNPFYGTNHKFNGFMDYYYVGNYASSAGLRNFILQYTYAHSEQFKAKLFVHQFYADGEVKRSANAEAMDANLGSELDLVLTWVQSADMKINFGYSQYFGTETTEFLKGGDASKTNNFAWLMLTLKPQLFNFK